MIHVYDSSKSYVQKLLSSDWLNFFWKSLKFSYENFVGDEVITTNCFCMGRDVISN